ncbi:hypothetical protein A33M_2894 [Rhodovulum sp. PH10]|nr:hypothetical protein A33M_2894 [Rhodovulum sp. PH10]
MQNLRAGRAHARALPGGEHDGQAGSRRHRYSLGIRWCPDGAG